jgi:tetratricopeptide (TPR) repeat protein
VSNAVDKTGCSHRLPEARFRLAWIEYWGRALPVCSLLIVTTFFVFWAARSFDFVNYDDQDYVTANPHVQSGLSWSNLKWAFTSGHASNWHPLTWLSHQLDRELLGVNPGPQHLVNVVFHALNAGLLFLVLRQLSGAHWRSALVSALFALHPLRAESVAWISERKDMLSAFFLFLTLGAYGRYAAPKELQTKPQNRLFWYGVSLACFALGLMCKPMVVTTPFLLLLLDYWPLGRLNDANFRSQTIRLIVEKIPFFLLTATSCVITYFVQRSGGAISTSLPFGDRAANALVSYIRYIVKTIWPHNLSVLYPHPGQWPAWEVAVAAILLTTLTVGALLQIRRRPYLLVGWFWFLGGLVPVIGVVQVGIQSMADRYTYLPSIGLFVIFSWALGEAVERRPLLRPTAVAAASLAIGICGLLCFHQIQFWRDSQTLFQRAVDVTSNNYLAYNNLGYFLWGRGQPEQAKENYIKSIAINPLYPDALNNLGFALAGEGKYGEAIRYYLAALRVSPGQSEIHNNLGNSYSELGHLNEAIEQYGIVLSQKPDHADANNNLGIALAMQGKFEQALEHFDAAIRSRPGYASAHSNRGNTLAALHRVADAVVEYQVSLRLNPQDAQAHNNLGNALMEQGKVEEAIREYAEALRLKGDNPETHSNMAIALKRMNRREEAVSHLEQALRLNPANTEARKQLDLLSPGQ